MTTRHSHRTATAALAAAALLALAGCTQGDADAGGSSTSASAPSPTTSSAPSSSSAGETGLSDTAAYTQADKNYRAWVQLTDNACNASNGSATPVAAGAASVATGSAIRTYNTEAKDFFKQETLEDDTVVRTTCKTTVRSTKGLEIRRQDPVSPWTLSLGVCLQTQNRAFNAKGKNIAAPQDGVQNGVVLLRSLDKGKTWLLDDESNLFNPTREDSCKY